MAKKKSKASNTSQTTVSVTPGKNKPVNNVIKFEDLVRHLKQVASVPARKQAGAKTAPPTQLTSIKQLATELEHQLRVVRHATPNKPASALSKRRKLKS
jgi:hypothetical protein